MKVGCLGPRGTFSEAAAHQMYDAAAVDFVLLPSIEEVFVSLGDGTIDCGVVPFENSQCGVIRATQEGLKKSPDLTVQAETVISVRHHLLTVPAASLETVREVWSNAAALEQCKTFLLQHGWPCCTMSSTAGAAAFVAESGRADVAAIASETAAKQLGLQILSADIQTAGVNDTRFVALKRSTIDSNGFYAVCRL